MLRKKRPHLDKVSITGLACRTRVGVFEWEKKRPQKILIDLDFYVETEEAVRQDTLHETANYYDITKKILAFLKERHFHLIETMADAIAGLCLKNFPIERIVVTVHKPGAIRMAQDVSATVERNAGNS